MRIGVDLGGTKIEIAALDEGGDIRFRRRALTPRGDYDATIRAIRALVDACERETGRGTVGIGIPGAVSPATGLIKNANSTWINGRRLETDLAAALGREVRLANDANCFALSEAVDGAAADARVVFGVIVGTGTGGGIVVDRRILVGPNAVAGEWGHNPLPWPESAERPGPPCYCGRTGCIETFLSGPGLVRDYTEGVPGGSEPGGGRGQAAAGEQMIDAAAVQALAHRGDAAAVAALERYAGRMARALATVINMLDPDAIVLGGGLSNMDAIYERVPALWTAYVFSDAVRTPLLRARYGDSSGVRGAAWLW